MENELYRQAILDAKAVRASAIANAKASLQEAFDTKIQEMLRMKLSEDLEEDMEEEGKQVEEGYGMEEEGKQVEEGDYVEEGMEEEGYAEVTEAELDEILAELEAMDEDHDPEVEESLNEAEEGEEGEEPTEDEPTEGEDEMEVTIKFSDLKDVLAPFVTSAEGEEGAPKGEEGGESTEDTLSLDEILAELEEGDYGHDPMEEAKEKHEEGKKHGMEEKKHHKMEVASKEELKEAKKTIAILSEKLQEINLLNAKLLYMNKIFKAKNLNESEKIRVVKSFDKAVSVKEVKNVYEILSESFTSKNKKSINESRGFASKPAGMAPKTPIVDSDPTVDRWQQLVFGNK